MPHKIVPVAVPQGAKWCHGCQSVKELAGFHVDRRRDDGRKSRCKACVKSAGRERQEMFKMFEEAHQRLLRNRLGL